jgi:hypothetical protein
MAGDKSSNTGPFSKVPAFRIGLRVYSLAVVGSLALAIAIKLALPQHALRAELFAVPELCWPGNAQSEFNQQKCGEFWVKRGWEGVVAATPFWLALIVSWLGIDSANRTYRRIRKLIRDEKAVKTATVSRPSDAWNDSFGWFRCFQSVAIDLPGGKRGKVYLPPDAPLPLPGEKVAWIELGRAANGSMRRAGFLYAPHVAIIRGVT